MSNHTLSLSPHPTFKHPKGPVVLIIMDGIGIGKSDNSNAIHLAKTPCIDTFSTHPLYTTLKAHGTAVGMPTDDDMGNSEVGHNTLGAGRRFDQGATLVQNAIKSNTLFQGNTWQSLIQNTQHHNSTLHFIGLLSDGNVHSHIDHLKTMITQASQEKIKKIRIHILLDGRDVGERTALAYIKNLEIHLDTFNHTGKDYQIASGGGRMITTMDRYNADWRIVERGWKTHVLGQGPYFNSAKEAVQYAYDNDPKLIDQYIPPFVIAKDNHPIGTIQNNDSVICFNFRGDRAIELTQAFESTQFTHFNRQRHPAAFYAGMIQYDGDLQLPNHYLVDPPRIINPLSHYLCHNNITSFAISETQKYGHVTYFWNGNNSGYINKNLETYIEIPSDTIPFDQAPKMKASEITKKTIELLNSRNYQFGRINFPNGDMVGHTGVMDAVIESVEETDRCVKKIIDTVNALNGITIILADHGNADEMFTIDKNGVNHNKTSHTLNPVPCVIFDSEYTGNYVINTTIQEPGLANIAATICNLLGFSAPDDYETSLIIPNE